MKKVRRRSFKALALIVPAALALVVTGISVADPGADLVISEHTDSPDPVVGSNIVQYKIVVSNLGGTATSDAEVNFYQYDACGESCETYSPGTILSAHGTGWTCAESEGWYCDHGAIAGLSSAAPIFINVRAPSVATTIANEAFVDTNTSEISYDNNNSTEYTDVVVDFNCDPGKVSCGTGHIDYGSPSSVSSGTYATADKWFVGTTFFPAVP